MKSIERLHLNNFAPFRAVAETAVMMHYTQFAVLFLTAIAVMFVRREFVIFPYLSALITAIAVEMIVSVCRGDKQSCSMAHSLVLAMITAFFIPAGESPMVISVMVIMVLILKHSQGGIGRYYSHPALVVLAGYELICRNEILDLCPMLYSNDISITLNQAVLADVLPDGSGFGMVDTFAQRIIGISDAVVGLSGLPFAICPLIFVFSGLYMVYRGYLNWRVPAVYLSAILLVVFLVPIKVRGGALVSIFDYSVAADVIATYIILHLYTGFAICGAAVLFIDISSRPLAIKGQVAAAFIAGTLTVIFRLHSPFIYPEVFALLFASLLTPLLDRVTRKQ